MVVVCFLPAEPSFSIECSLVFMITRLLENLEAIQSCIRFAARVALKQPAGFMCTASIYVYVVTCA